MSDIVEFLRARLDEDEAIAEAGRLSLGDDGSAEVVEWEQPYGSNVWLPDGNTLVAGGEYGQPLAEPVGRHIARHDPARVLREVAAKRELLVWSEAMAPSMGQTLQELLAAPYSDHPGYRQEWTP
jgi:hypothetical protein